MVTLGIIWNHSATPMWQKPDLPSISLTATMQHSTELLFSGQKGNRTKISNRSNFAFSISRMEKISQNWQATKQHQSELILISPLRCLEIENALEKMKKGFLAMEFMSFIVDIAMPYTLTTEFSPLSSLPQQEGTKKSKSTTSGVQFLTWLSMGTTAGRALD